MEPDALPLRVYGLALLLATMLAGACIAGPDELCRQGAVSCNGACVDPQRNPSHCGACGQACGDRELCVAGACTPACGEQASCGSVCVDLTSDPRHCGACGVACGQGEVCRGGACLAGCDGGALLCEGRCTDVAHDESNCGACGEVCGPDQVCREGDCACPDILTTAAHCGACDSPCAEGSRCTDGRCQALCDGRACAPGDTVWAQRMGEPGGPVTGDPRQQELRALAYGPSGRLFAALEARRTTRLLGAEVEVSGLPNLVLAELDARGRAVGVLHPPGGGLEVTYAMAVADGSVWVAGHYDSDNPMCGLPPHQGDHDGFVVRFDDALTECSMVAALSSPDDARIEGMSLAGDTIALSGRTEGPATWTLADGTSVDLPHAGGIDAFLGALHRDGTLRWAQTVGGPGDEVATGIAAADEAVIVTGYYDEPWGELPASQSGQRALWIRQLDLDGATSWTLGVPVTSSSGNHRAEGVAVAHHGGRSWILGTIRGAVDVAGKSLQSLVGTIDVVLLEIDSTGQVLRATAYGDEGQEEAAALWVDARGLLITGSFQRRIDFGSGLLQGTSDDDDDAFVAAFDLDGTPRWSRAFGGRSFESPRAIAGFRGRVSIGGIFRQDIDPGQGVLFSPRRIRNGQPVNEDDAFVATLSR